MNYDIILSCNYSPWSKYKGGGQKSTHMIATHLAEMGFNVAVIYSKGILERITLPTDLKYKVHWAFFFAFKPNMSAPFRFLNPWSYKRLLHKISSEETVLHSNGEEAAFYKRVPHKKWIHSNRFPDFPEYILRFPLKTTNASKGLFFRDPKYANVQNCIQQADQLTATSLHNQKRVLEVFGKKAHIVPNGIDSLFLEKQWSPENKKGIFYYGRMVKAKGVDTLLQAYASLPVNIRQLHPLHLIGEGKEAEELQQLAKNLNIMPHCTFQAWANGTEIRNHLLQNALCVLPSREESFGNTMLESLATGIPLITTNAGSIPEVVGNQATLVTANSPKQLLEAIENYFSKDAPNNAQKQQDYISQRFSWKSTCETFVQLYGLGS